MNLYNIYTTFPSTIGKVLLFLVCIGLLAGCEKGDPTENNGPLAGGYSILVNNGNILVSGFRSQNGQVNTRYWVNGESTNQSTFAELVENQSTYRQAVDEKFRTVKVYKDRDGANQLYQFAQGGSAEAGKIHYYKNNSIVRMDNDSVGRLSAVAFEDGTPLFAGYLGEYWQDNAGGSTMYPRIAFVWDGQSPITELNMLADSAAFKGVSAIYQAGADEFYVGGLYGRPMYWKNTDPVVLDERYGEVWQIIKSGSDIYAAGLINKYNSNSTGHTACYWKNGELHELEDRAQAFGIFVDGEDVYISGAVGNVPASYRPCYWKNGVRVDLPM